MVAHQLPGPARFAVLLAGLGLVFTVVAIVVYPEAYRQYIQDVGIKRFERQFGFRSGQVAWPEPGRGVTSVWGIVSVTPGGALARSGVRDGDIPTGQHDRVVDFYGALEEASAGRASSLDVFNTADTHQGAGVGVRRTITLLPPGPSR